MPIRAIKLCRSTYLSDSLIQLSLIHSIPSLQTLEQSIKSAVESKRYEQIPVILNSSEGSYQYSNPFLFLSTYPHKFALQIIDEMLQSFIPLRPRSHLQMTYACLLSHTLHSPNPLPLALAILQRTLRSGCLPPSQTHLLLSSAWLSHGRRSQSVCNILLEMRSIGYHPDCGTCNYLISSLCAVDQMDEAVKVLKGMAAADCCPDSASYDAVIGAMCEFRRINYAMQLMREMVTKMGLTPKEGLVVKLMVAARANKEIWRAIEMIECLQSKGFSITFESYELVLDGCLDDGKFVLAAKVVMMMTEKGYIPYIMARQKVVEGLASVGEWKLACTVRQRFAELNS